jgi:two-component system OmpR family sensor kinase
VPLSEVVEVALERWQRPAERSGHRLLARGDGGPVVAATEADLAVIVDNLVENALRYSPGGTTVTIEWAVGGGTASLAVLDEGPGIAAGEHEHVFDRFYRGTAGRSGPSGTGLGLSVVEALARRWDGSALVEARPDGGTRAEVRMPLLREVGASDVEPSPDTQLDDALPGPG